MYENKNERQSYDYLPFSTQDDSILELFYKNLYQLYDLKETFEEEGIDKYPYSSSNSLGVSDNSLLHTRN